MKHLIITLTLLFSFSVTSSATTSPHNSCEKCQPKTEKTSDKGLDSISPDNSLVNDVVMTGIIDTSIGGFSGL